MFDVSHSEAIGREFFSKFFAYLCCSNIYKLQPNLCKIQKLNTGNSRCFSTYTLHVFPRDRLCPASEWSMCCLAL